MSNNKEEKILKSLERMKEIQRIQYDYFKFMIPVNPPLILIVFALLGEVLDKPQLIVILFAYLSIIGFAASIVISMLAIPPTVNAIIKINELRISMEIERNSEKAEECLTKINKTIESIKCSNLCLQISFIGGIVMVVLSATFHFFN